MLPGLAPSRRRDNVTRPHANIRVYPPLLLATRRGRGPGCPVTRKWVVSAMSFHVSSSSRAWNSNAELRDVGYVGARSDDTGLDQIAGSCFVLEAGALARRACHVGDGRLSNIIYRDALGESCRGTSIPPSLVYLCRTVVTPAR